MNRNKILALLLVITLLTGCNAISKNTESKTPKITKQSGATTSFDGGLQKSVTENIESQGDKRVDSKKPNYPDAVTDSSRVDESQLLRDHIYSLINRSSGVRSKHRQISFWTHNDSQLLDGIVRVSANETEYIGKINSSRHNSVGYFWENSSVEYVQNVPSGDWIYEDSWYGKYDDPHRTLGSVSYTERLRWLIVDIELAPVKRGYTSNDEPRIVFENVNQSGSEKFTNKMLMDELSNFSLQVAARPDGMITNVTWRLNGTYNGEPVNRTETWKYEYGVNVSTRPDWLETAREEAQAIEVTQPTNISYRIEHLGDKTVPAGARISVLTPTATTKVTLEESFEPTDVVYIAAPNQTLQTYRTQPSGDEFLPLPGRVSIGVLIGPANAMGDSHPESFRWREFLVEEAE